VRAPRRSAVSKKIHRAWRALLSVLLATVVIAGVAISSPAYAADRTFASAPRPTVSGSASVGTTLTASTGAWSPSPTRWSFQWKRDGVAISGATSSSYRLVSADAGRAVTVTVVGSKSGYQATSRTSLVSAVAAMEFSRAPVPTLSGTATVGSDLTVVAGSWAPAPSSQRFQWRRDGVAITGATSSTYRLVAADAGTTVTATVTSVKSGYRTTSRTSTGTAVAAQSFSLAPRPTLAGSSTVGSRLTASVGTWSPTPSRTTLQWKRGGTAIPGATGASYTLVAADAGASITVTVTGTKSGYRNTTRTSDGVTVSSIAFTTAPAPSIGGDAVVGGTLTANSGGWSPAPGGFTYQWIADGVAIAGASSPTFSPTSAEVGKKISVTVTGSLAGYVPTSRTSAATSPVSPPPLTGVAAVRTQRMIAPTLNSTQDGWYEAGATLTLSCYVHGQAVQGHFSPYVGNGGWDSLWYRVNDGRYVADVDLETQTLDPLGNQCEGGPAPDSTNATVMATTQRMTGATLNSAQNGSYGQGNRLTLVCHQRGQAVQGYFSPQLPNGGWDDLWYKVDDGFFVADVDIETGSNDPIAPACAAPPAANGNTTLERAKTWLDARVPYNQRSWYTNQFGSYRQDCSGFVSMALGLSTSYVTGTLPQVLTRISKDDLQPGDIMLNTAPGNSGHTAIFVRWANDAHTSYVSWEENGAAGRAFEQTVPYPYWPQWEGSSNYLPYRKN